MKKYLLVTLASFLLLNCYSQKEQEIFDFPMNFSDNCYKHIEELASYGLRAAELESETKTIKYLSDKLAESDIKITVDTFKYKYFIYDSATVMYQNQRIKFNRLFINPYIESYGTESDCILLNAPIENSEKIFNDKIIVASESYKFFDLFKINAKAIIVIKDSLYKEIEKQPLHSTVLLKLYGNIKEYKTYNLIGCSSPYQQKKKEIIISAHWDSFKGPGADDNASGVSVLLELARYFQKIKDSIPFNIKYVALGAEEMGLLGAQAFVRKHKDEFNNGFLNINLDMIGGRRGILLSVQENSYKNIVLSEPLYACRDSNLRWIMISPNLYKVMFFETRKIELIETILRKVSDKSDIEYKYDSFDGDHCVIALSGIPSIGICVMGNKYHSPLDIPEQINKSSLEQVGKLVTDFILIIKNIK